MTICGKMSVDLVVAKFGGSAIGENGRYIPDIIKNVQRLSADSKVVSVFSAPLVLERDERRSLTDVVMRVGRSTERSVTPNLDAVKDVYDKIMVYVDEGLRKECQDTIDEFLSLSLNALQKSYDERKFADINRAEALGYSGELLMARVMNFIFRSNGIDSSIIPYRDWPIITTKNYEYANFLVLESKKRIQPTLNTIKDSNVTCIGGFIGKTIDGQMSTYERGGTDRTAADMGILLQKYYNVRITWEKDSTVASADPQVVKTGLSQVKYLSYNEAPDRRNVWNEDSRHHGHERDTGQWRRHTTANYRYEKSGQNHHDSTKHQQRQRASNKNSYRSRQLRNYETEIF